MILGIKVNALSINTELEENGIYVNSEGLKITEEFYNKVNNIITDEELDLIDRNIYDIINKEKIVTIDMKVLETTYLNITNNKFIITENIMTPVQYIEGKAETRAVSDHHETNYKVITLIVTDKGTNYSFYIQNSWQQPPSTKSYDVIALRWSGSVSEDTSKTKGQQTYTATYQEVNGTEINYSPTSGNYKYFSNGVGLSQNLDDDGNYFTNMLSIPATCSGSVTVYGTYQHAQSAVTLAQSQSYTLSNSGLGNVLYYSNSTIRNKYDNTSGLSVNFTC